MKHGSLFSGIGGADLGFERAGIAPAWWVENNDDARQIMERHWPDVPGYGDIRDFLRHVDEVEWVECITGGDPCPVHSRARSSHATSVPDLSGYFLAVVAAMRPRWVVRENVRSPSVADVALGLELLGYGSIVIEMDAAPITGQSRVRAFTVGRYQTSRSRLRNLIPGLAPGPLPARTTLGTATLASCLTTHRTRYDSRDNYIFEYNPERQRYCLRVPDAEEREALAGFPRDWTGGLHEATRARLLGNSCVPQIMEQLAAGIVGYELAASQPAEQAGLPVRGQLSGLTWD